MEWDSPWGRGFPGWHIECSAMAHKYLGEYFDIHCGGEDHITVHHPNEISQTEAAYGTRLANFWMHGYFILLNSAKMSKSSGEFLRVQLLIDKGYDPIAYRYLCLTAHYRSQLTFSWDALDAAQTALERLRNTAHGLGAPSTADQDFVGRFMAMLNDDLNFPQAAGADLRNAQVGPWGWREETTLLKFGKRSVLDLRAGYPRSRMFQPMCAGADALGCPQRQRTAGRKPIACAAS